MNAQQRPTPLALVTGASSGIIDLLGKDMFQPGVIVREGLPHLLAAVKALDDFRNVQTGLHVGVQEGLAGVIEAAGVFLLQQIGRASCRERV